MEVSTLLVPNIAKNIKVGEYAIINNHTCVILNTLRSGPGKRDSSKITLIGRCIKNNKKYLIKVDDTFIVNNVNVKKQTYEAIFVENNELQVLTKDIDIKILKISPEDSIKIKKLLDEKKEVIVSTLTILELNDVEEVLVLDF
jgi:translation elongation factor P/translation initiation factor 5A